MNSAYINGFTKRLKKARKNYGFSQKEVNEALNVPTTRLSKYETGWSEPNIDTIYLLASYYGVSSDWLLGIDQTDNGKPSNKTVSKWNGLKTKTSQFPVKLRKARIKSRMTQTRVAEILQIRQSSIAKYENGLAQPSLETLAKLTLFYGVTCDWLIGLKDDKDDIEA